MRLLCVMLFSSNKAHDRHLNIFAKSCVHEYCVQVQVLMSLYQGHAMHLGGPWNIWKKEKQLSCMSTIKIGRDVDANEKDNILITCQLKSEIGSTN